MNFFPNLQYVKKLAPLELEISRERGPFSLFGFFKPDEGLGDKWKIIVSAPWIVPTNHIEVADYIIAKIRERLTNSEMLGFGGVVPLDEDIPELMEILDEYEVEHGLLRIDNWIFFRTDMRLTYLVTAKKSHLAKASVPEAVPA